MNQQAQIFVIGGSIVSGFTVCRLAADRYYQVGVALGECIYRRWLQAQAREFDAVHTVPGTRFQAQILERTHSAEVIADPVYDPDNLKLRA